MPYHVLIMFSLRVQMVRVEEVFGPMMQLDPRERYGISELIEAVLGRYLYSFNRECLIEKSTA